MTRCALHLRIMPAAVLCAACLLAPVQLTRGSDSAGVPREGVRLAEAEASEEEDLAEARSKLAATQRRLETLSLRFEERLAQLEKYLKRGGLIPLDKQENEAEMQRLGMVLKDARQRLEAAEAEVQRLTRSLPVPEMIGRLSPEEGLHDPRYRGFRPYFEARRASDLARLTVNAAEDAFTRVALKSY